VAADDVAAGDSHNSVVVADAGRGGLADPPDGFGTQLLFKQVPLYMQNILRRMWARLTDIERDNVRNNLEGWERSAKAPDYKGNILVGEGTTVTDENNTGRTFKPRQTYGNAGKKLS